MSNSSIDWAALAAPIPDEDIQFRRSMDDRPDAYVAYIDARTVHDRLNAVCPGAWSYSWELIQVLPNGDWIVKGRLTIGGQAHEDVGVGELKLSKAGHTVYGGPEKAAVSDALKRCAVQVGIGRNLYDDAAMGALLRARGLAQQPHRPKTTPAQPPNPAPVPPPAPAVIADDLPSDDLLMTDLTGMQCAALQRALPPLLGIVPAHYRNRMRARFGTTDYRRIEGVTVGEFVARMADQGGSDGSVSS